MKIPVLLDTDIGTDIDDALALAYMLKQPECELLGITTVTGQPQIRAQLADAVCRALGYNDLPIHSGTDNPLKVPQRQTEAPQRTVLAKYPHKEDFKPNTAVDFLQQTIRARPGEITLLTIGPLTNIAHLFNLDPQIPELLKQHVMMGGLYFDKALGYGQTEWNTSGDPHATDFVFSHAVPKVYCIGLDVTTCCKMSADECRKRFSKEPYQIIGEMAEVWFDRRSEITFHDPLAAACIFEPLLCTFESGLVRVELQDGQKIGRTSFNPRQKQKPHQVAVDVNSDAFFKHYFDICR
ncbi:MAG: nucleoside hydrolase [Planctomycetota bacterium]|nr:MAG: nucleoside hydrolase [Planctomycetota bacterium]